MAYVERDDHDLDLNDQSDVFDDDSLFDEIYEAENFGERVYNGDDEEVVDVDSEEAIITENEGNSDEDKIDENFGETVSSDLESQEEDEVEIQKQDTEAKNDSKKEGFFSKAKDKLDEWTDKDQRE